MEFAFQLAVIAIGISTVISTVAGIAIMWSIKPWKF